MATTGSVSASVASLADKLANKPYTATAKVSDDGTGISAGSTVLTGDPSGGRVTTKELGKDDFLLLLTTQLRYQDPLSPMDNSQFIAQLAQFQSLESNNNIEKAIEELNTSYKDSLSAQMVSSTAMSNSAALTMIGQTARVAVKNITWDGVPGHKLDIPIYIGNHTEATVTLSDSNGDVVKTFKPTDKGSDNTVHCSWNGTDDSGKPMQAGTYTVDIEGADKDSSLYAYVQDTVNGVRFTGTGTVVKIHGMELPVENVLDVALNDGTNGGLVAPGNAVSLIGKSVRVLQSSIVYNQEKQPLVPIKVNAAPGTKVAVSICYASGEVVQNLTGTADQHGIAQLSWNGSTVNGDYAKTGTYSIVIAGQEKGTSVYSFVEGKVDGVTNLNSNPQLRIGGVGFSMADIIDVSNG